MCLHFLSPWSLVGKELHTKNRFPEDSESYCIYSEDETVVTIFIDPKQMKQDILVKLDNEILYINAKVMSLSTRLLFLNGNAKCRKRAVNSTQESVDSARI